MKQVDVDKLWFVYCIGPEGSAQFIVHADSQVEANEKLKNKIQNDKAFGNYFHTPVNSPTFGAKPKDEIVW